MLFFLIPLQQPLHLIHYLSNKQHASVVMIKIHLLLSNFRELRLSFYLHSTK